MLDSVAFIGYGFVGKACHKAFEHNTKAIIIDPKYSDITIGDLELLQPKLIFVSINAPTLEDRSVDTSIIYNIFQQLTDIKYKGLVVLKSTLPPDIVEDLYDKFGSDSVMSKIGPLRYIYSPEFLREKSWEKDAVNPPMVVLAGNFHDCKELEMLYKNHSQLPLYTRFFHTEYYTAAMVKYSINTFLAMKVTFMNQIYQMYSDHEGHNSNPHPEIWRTFTEMLAADVRFGGSHLQVPGNEGQYGYGGSCFPKDIKAFIGYDKNERLSLLREVELINTQIRLTGNGKSE